MTKILATSEPNRVTSLAKHTEELLYLGTESGRFNDFWTKDRSKKVSFILPYLSKHPETVWNIFTCFIFLIKTNKLIISQLNESLCYQEAS